MRSNSKILLGLAALAFSSLVSAAPIYWTDWTGSDTDPGAGFQGQGTITTSSSSVAVTYTNANRNDSISPYTSSVVDNSPTGTDIVALSRAGSQTLLFSQSIANPVFAFVSLNGNGYAFLNQDFNILSVGGVDGNACGYWGCGGVTKVVTDLGGGNFLYALNSSNVGGSEPHGVIQFTGAFDTLTWNSASNEFWNGFTVGVQGTAAEVFPPTNNVPEPGTLLLAGLGLFGLAMRGRRKG
ncbi:MAG: PEP-CTERM sorting domain-containing protein [Betaproteobacteria bacterium HGW-Betaproteobacteria-4]|nr:MAG: PEP-CTERM sorting domain-containing protein [Betaproteobacteria bacterium HGW-Betaproteobacteria-4]